MRATVTTLATVALIVSMVAALPAAGLAQGAVASGPNQAPIHEQQQTEDGPDENASDIAPGERLVGVVGVQEAEIEGEIENRAFGLKIARAATANAKADVVKAQLDSIGQRLQALEQRKQQLDEAREDGEISDGRYQAEIAALAAQTESVKRLTDQSEARAGELPRDLLESKDINVTAIQLLKQNAENLTGPQVAEIARSIAGNSVGQPVAAANRPGDAGPPANRGPGAASGEDADGNQTADGDRRGPGVQGQQADRPDDGDDDENETADGDQSGGDSGGNGYAY